MFPKKILHSKWAWIACGTLILAGCGLGGPAHQQPMANAAAVVDMGFHDFHPATVTIHKGDTVEWRNTSLIKHTVTDEPAKAQPGFAAVPKGGQPFDSGGIKAGGVYSHTFTAPGTYKYYCEIHEKHGMKGTVIVQP